MKTKKTLIFFFAILISLYAKSQIKVASNGNVGIGHSNPPTYRLDIAGNVRFGNWTSVILDWNNSGGMPALYPENNNWLWLGRSDRWINHLWVYTINYKSLVKNSDQSIKENINIMPSVLSKVKQINSYTYNYKDEFFKGFTKEQKEEAKRTEFGFIAQEINDIFPELIYKSDTGLMSIDYTSMIPVLTQAIKEQQVIIEDLQKKVNEINILKSSLVADSISNRMLSPTNLQNLEITNVSKAMLEQNAPNPFNITTYIKYYLPNTTNSAMIFIYNLQGTQMKSFNISGTGEGCITINGSELMPGMYYYSLIVDGNEVDTKKMILTK